MSHSPHLSRRSVCSCRCWQVDVLPTANRDTLQRGGALSESGTLRRSRGSCVRHGVVRSCLFQTANEIMSVFCVEVWNSIWRPSAVLECQVAVLDPAPTFWNGFALVPLHQQPSQRCQRQLDTFCNLPPGANFAQCHNRQIRWYMVFAHRPCEEYAARALANSAVQQRLQSLKCCHRVAGSNTDGM